MLLPTASWIRFNVCLWSDLHMRWSSLPALHCSLSCQTYDGVAAPHRSALGFRLPPGDESKAQEAEVDFESLLHPPVSSSPLPAAAKGSGGAASSGAGAAAPTSEDGTDAGADATHEEEDAEAALGPPPHLQMLRTGSDSMEYAMRAARAEQLARRQ